jgi:hypothetical protein
MQCRAEGEEDTPTADTPTTPPKPTIPSPQPPTPNRPLLPPKDTTTIITQQPKIPGKRDGQTDPALQPYNCQDIANDNCKYGIGAKVACGIIHIDCLPDADGNDPVGHFCNVVPSQCGAGAAEGTTCYYVTDGERQFINGPISVPPGGDANSAIHDALNGSKMNPCPGGFDVEFGPGNTHPADWPGNNRPPYLGNPQNSPFFPFEDT